MSGKRKRQEFIRMTQVNGFYILFNASDITKVVPHDGNTKIYLRGHEGDEDYNEVAHEFSRVVEILDLRYRVVED